MSRDAIIECTRTIIAEFEHRCRTEGVALDKAIDAHTKELLTHGVGLPGASDEYRAQCMKESWAYADRGRVRAAALTRVSRVLIRVLRAIGGEPIYDRDAVPPTVRDAKRLMHIEDTGIDERESIQLPPISVIEQEARAHGLLVEESNGSEHQSKE